jgi:hypothetical protein
LLEARLGTERYTYLKELSQEACRLREDDYKRIADTLEITLGIMTRDKKHIDMEE